MIITEIRVNVKIGHQRPGIALWRRLREPKMIGLIGGSPETPA
ncbi:MAG: hypothetical protein WD623_15735 [Marinobacter sp.]